MSKKVNRNRSPLNTTINRELHEKIRDLSAKTDIPISKLLDRAIELLLEDFKDKKF